MKPNPIEKGLDAAADALFEKHGQDVHRVAEYLRERSQAAGRATVSFRAKPPRPKQAVKRRRAG